MAKGDTPPGISARLEGLLLRAMPPDLSERQFCIQSKVSTSFFTDLRKGVEPGIDKVERLANRAGIRLSRLVADADAPRAGRFAVPLALPSEPRLQTMMSAMLKSAGHQAPAELVDALVRQLPNALEQAGAVLAPAASARSTSLAVRSPRPARKGRGSTL